MKHRIDIAAIAADVERRRAQRVLEAYKPALIDPVREARLLVGMIFCERVLDACEDVEVYDFDDYRHQAIFAIVRRLQFNELDHGFPDVLAAITDDGTYRHLVDAFLTYANPLGTEFGNFLGERCITECRERLRQLAERRRAL